MVIDKNSKDIKQLENGDYVYNGNIEVEDLIIDLDDRFVVNGFIKVERQMESNVTIEAVDYIKAGSSIEAGDGILAMLWIKANTYIKARLRIFAGLCNWRNIKEYDMTITSN